MKELLEVLPGGFPTELRRRTLGSYYCYLRSLLPLTSLSNLFGRRKLFILASPTGHSNLATTLSDYHRDRMEASFLANFLTVMAIGAEGHQVTAAASSRLRYHSTEAGA